jgi:U3 small nucleolar RNA-associated protein 10
MRHAIVQAATNNTSFASILNTYVLRISKARQHHHALLAFWAGIMVEATSGMLDKSRSGRKGVQQQNEQDVILRLLPTLNEGLAMKKVPDLRIGCYALLTIIASKGGLDDKLLSAMMEAVVLGWTTETITPGLVCLSVLVQHRGGKQLTKRVTRELLKVQNLPSLLVELSKQRRVDKLANGLCLALIDRLGRTGDVTGLPIVVQAIETQLLNDPQTVVIVKALLLVAYKVDYSLQAHRDMRSDLASSLVTITQLPGHVGTVVRGALKDSSVDIDDLEIKLHATIRREEISALPSEDAEMQDLPTDDSSTAHTFSELFNQLPTRTATESSFLSHTSSHIYQDLCQAFIAASPSSADLKLFDKSPILRRESALDDTLYLSFYMKTWCGPNPVIARTSALQLANQCLSKNKGSNVDVQAVIPYAIAALGDPATRVRRAAAELLIGIEEFYPATIDSKKTAKQYRQWAFDDIYGPGEDTQETKWLSLDIIIRFLREMLVPALEECVLDSKHIRSLFEKSLNTPRNFESPKKSEAKRLPQTARASILSFLGSHVVHTPVFLLKLRLLEVLNQVRSIAGTSRTRVLLPVLQQWASFSPSEALGHCIEEKIEPRDFDDQTLMTIVANDEEGFQFLTHAIDGEVATDRPKLIEAVFRRLRALWPSLKGESRLQIAQTLLDSSQCAPDDVKYNEAASEASADLLRTASLSTDILISFLSQLPTAAKLADKPPATKRRRTSHGEVAKVPIQDAKQLSAAIRKVTFVLQLIDSSDPGTHPELTKGLFNTLAELQHFKSQVASELAYLQGLVLSSLLVIMRSHKLDPDMKLDPSAVRADLLVDCVQKTASPQVQNTALLLIASLAETAPEVVLHSVMPIFTFIGSSVLRQNDEYSAHVIDQTIREVIPPLIASLRKEKGDPVTGAAELLLSFVAAYEHVPPHRRRGLLTLLVQTLGPEDFLFALLAMLVDKYGPTDNIKTFAVELASAFSVEVQLQSAVKYLDLVGDILKPKPTQSSILLGANDETVRDPHRCALNELMLLPHLLSQKRLVSQTGKLLDRDDMDAARIRDLYSTLLENLLGLADTVKDHKRLHGACGDVLESLLGLLSTREFVKSVEGLLDRPNESLRRKILRSLEVRIDQESPSNDVSRVAILGFLPQLTAIIRESKDVLYKHTAVACVDKISEKYGKKDLEAVSAAAETIASVHCLGQSDNHLRVMALLCLASLVEILREGIVSVLPIAIPKALEYMEGSMTEDNESQKLHSAGYVFISSLVHHLPYMVSGGFLDRLLQISNTSAEAGLDDEADESRIRCLQFAAKQIDAKSLFTALEKNWETAAAAGVLVRFFFDNQIIN